MAKALYKILQRIFHTTFWPVKLFLLEQFTIVQDTVLVKLVFDYQSLVYIGRIIFRQATPFIEWIGKWLSSAMHIPIVGSKREQCEKVFP